jgi:hypothetical protein
LGGLTGGSPVDAAAPDASTDAPPAEGGSWCAHQDATFCDDFDEQPLGKLWTSVATSGGALALDSDAAISLPNSLLAAIPGGGDGAPKLSKVFTGTASRLHCDFELRVDTASPIGEIDVFDVVMTWANSGLRFYRLALVLKASSSTFIEDAEYEDGGVLNPYVNLPLLAQGAWTRVILDVDLASAHANIDYDGTPVGQLALHPAAQATSQTVSVGITGSYSPAGTTERLVRVDSVACTVTP